MKPNGTEEKKALTNKKSTRRDKHNEKKQNDTRREKNIQTQVEHIKYANFFVFFVHSFMRFVELIGAVFVGI